MTEITNFSLLNGANFRFNITRASYLSFFTQTVALPTIYMRETENDNPFSTIYHPGDHIEYEPLSVTFIVDENLSGYLEIYNWMKGLGFPDSFEEYSELVAAGDFDSPWKGLAEDIVVTTMTGARGLNLNFAFKDAFPISLTAPTLTTTEPGVKTLTCVATFRYSTFDLTTI
jgi:hypothetical protein